MIRLLRAIRSPTLRLAVLLALGLLVGFAGTAEASLESSDNECAEVSGTPSVNPGDCVYTGGSSGGSGGA